LRLSVAVITLNEERNLGRTLESVRALADEIVVVDCGSTDHTREIARSFGAQVFVKEWKGYAAQKNSAIEKCAGDWVLSLDADETVEPRLAQEIRDLLAAEDAKERPGRHEPLPQPQAARQVSQPPSVNRDSGRNGYFIPRKNFFLDRWIKHGGFWPDSKLRLFRCGTAKFDERPVHETMRVSGCAGRLQGALLHRAYPTLEGYIAQMNRYSSLGAELAVSGRKRGFSLVDIVLRPALTFVYNYFLRLGFLDGREGLLLHLYHSVYVSWKYAKAWEKSRATARCTPADRGAHDAIKEE
jgi:glycosyltransferase involved in cell wall biosynthesis